MDRRSRLPTPSHDKSAHDVVKGVRAELQCRPVAEADREAIPSGAGRTFKPELHAAIEARRGHDLSRMRIHADAATAASGARLGVAEIPFNHSLASRAAIESAAEHAAREVQRLDAGARMQPTSSETTPPADIGLGPGQRLDALTRHWFERRFGRDFGDVRVHTGPSAAQAAESLGAEAVTYGPHVVFGEGRYAPGTGEGRSLLAHELTHVVQQRDSGTAFVACRNGAAPARPAPRPGQHRRMPVQMTPRGKRHGRPDPSTGQPLKGVPEPTYIPEPGDPEYFWHSFRGWAAQEFIASSPPLATLARGRKTPPFVSTEIVGQEIWSPETRVDPAYEASRLSGKRFHVLDAIEYDVEHARSAADLERVLIDYIGDPYFDFFNPVLLPIGREQRRLPIVFPPNFDPDGLRSQVFAAAVAKKAELAEKLAEEPEKAPALKSKPKKEPKQTPKEIILRLPSVKRGHLRRYESLLRTRTLEHDPKNTRDRNIQAREWDKEMDPRAPDGIHWEIYEGGRSLGLEHTRILRPNWSRDVPTMPMEVDHVVELQVLSPAQRDSWGDTISNWELLDEVSNRISGTAVRLNIIAERLRLVEETGDFRWMKARLVFTRVVADPGPRGHRWVAQAIRDGDHLHAWRKHRGEVPEGR